MKKEPTPATTITVLIPSHRRPRELRRCISHLSPQLSDSDELIVVHRRDDAETASAAVEASERTVLVPVTDPGVWPALTTGIRASSRDVVAFLDDDAIPMDGWVEAIRRHLVNEPTVGAVGGPILNFHGVRTSNSFFEGGFIARATSAGRLHSRLHELPASRRVSEVDFLPGSNMAIRRELINLHRYPMIGMAPALEWRVALAVRRSGFRVVYDSDIRVEHHPAPRELSRDDRERTARDVGYSMTAIAALELRSTQRIGQLAWWALAGSRESPGLLFAPAAVLRGRDSLKKWRAAAWGRALAIRAACQAENRA
ncbi:glycosyltransferase family 2 protein [Streptomyces sp. NPDC002078]